MRSHPGNESKATSIEIIKIEYDDATNRRPRSLSTTDIPTPHKEKEKESKKEEPPELSASEPLSNTKTAPIATLSFSSPRHPILENPSPRKKLTFEIVHLDDLQGRIDRLCHKFTSEARAIKYLMNVIIAATNEDTPSSMYQCRGNLCVRFAKQHFILTIKEIIENNDSQLFKINKNK